MTTWHIKIDGHCLRRHIFSPIGILLSFQQFNFLNSNEGLPWKKSPIDKNVRISNTFPLFSDCLTIFPIRHSASYSHSTNSIFRTRTKVCQSRVTNRWKCEQILHNFFHFCISDHQIVIEFSVSVCVFDDWEIENKSTSDLVENVKPYWNHTPIQLWCRGYWFRAVRSWRNTWNSDRVCGWWNPYWIWPHQQCQFNSILQIGCQHNYWKIQ